jgi:hypothetical protein
VGDVTITTCLVDEDGQGLTGEASSFALKIVRHSDGALLDWNDMTFKSSAWVSPSVPLAEMANLPGWYYKTITITGWSDGSYSASLVYNDGEAVGGGDFAIYSGTEEPGSSVGCTFLRMR